MEDLLDMALVLSRTSASMGLPPQVVYEKVLELETDYHQYQALRRVQKRVVALTHGLLFFAVFKPKSGDG
jgi:hypothetical protein